MAARVIVGYDGSPEASAAIDVGALLFPGAHAWITYLWGPSFASDKLRRRLRAIARNVNELIDMVEREGEREAQRIAAMGVTLAQAAGWDAEPLLKRTLGGEGLRIAEVADDMRADLVLVGSRGLSGTQAVLDSFTDVVVHYCAQPVVVVPHPMLATEYAVLPDGAVVVGWDCSAGAETAFAAARRLFPQREVVLVSVDGDAPANPPADSSHEGHEISRVSVDRGHGFPARTVAKALDAAAGDRNAALVVVGSRGRSAAREILVGSVAMATLHHSQRPVMVVPSEWEIL